MIYSKLDNDLYKISMAQLVLHNFTNTYVEYDLQIRSDVDLRPIKDDVERCIMDLRMISLSPEEKEFLKTIKYLSPDFIEWFENYRYNPEIDVRIWNDDKNLRITVYGDWLHRMFYEVQILSIVSECWNLHNHEISLGECTRRLEDKISFVRNECPDIKFSEFGTRRRFSYFVHDHVISTLARELPDNLIGTSNMHFAMKYGLTPMGTQAHEIYMNSLVLFPIHSCQRDMMYAWSREFLGNLGYVLTDTFGVDKFLKDFTLDLAKLYSGVRQDSGDPFIFGHKIIKHYESLGIDPKTKYIVFSDNLNFVKAKALYDMFHDKITTSFGIGTFLTNDCGVKPLSIVMKVQECNGFPVAKLSDDTMKSVCRNENYLKFLKDIFS